MMEKRFLIRILEAVQFLHIVRTRGHPADRPLFSSKRWPTALSLVLSTYLAVLATMPLTACVRKDSVAEPVTIEAVSEVAFYNGAILTMADEQPQAEAILIRGETINAAYATFEEDSRGSLAPGKLADLVILSANPLTIPAEELAEIEVLMTMVGGKVEWCMAGYEWLCPGSTGSCSTVNEPIVRGTCVAQGDIALEELAKKRDNFERVF